MCSYAWSAEKLELAYGSSWTGSTSCAASIIPPGFVAAAGAAGLAAGGAAAAAGAVVAAGAAAGAAGAAVGAVDAPEMFCGTTAVALACAGAAGFSEDGAGAC